MNPKKRRKKRLVKPGLQLRWAVLFLMTAGVAMVLQGTLTLYLLSRVAVNIPHDGEIVMNEAPRLLALNLAWTAAMLVPLMITVVILATHRVAGPLHRLEEHLRGVLAGAAPTPCRLRQGDELQELCGLVNGVLARLEGVEGESVEEVSSPPDLESVPALTDGAGASTHQAG